MTQNSVATKGQWKPSQGTFPSRCLPSSLFKAFECLCVSIDRTFVVSNRLSWCSIKGLLSSFWPLSVKECVNKDDNLPWFSGLCCCFHYCDLFTLIGAELDYRKLELRGCCLTAKTPTTTEEGTFPSYSWSWRRKASFSGPKSTKTEPYQRLQWILTSGKKSAWTAKVSKEQIDEPLPEEQALSISKNIHHNYLTAAT